MQDSLARRPTGRFFGQITGKGTIKKHKYRKNIEAEDIIITVLYFNEDESAGAQESILRNPFLGIHSWAP
jgi:hypothetical protein